MSDSEFGLLEIGWVRELNAVCNSPRLLALVLDRIDALPDDIEAMLYNLRDEVAAALVRREIPAGPSAAPDPAPALMPVADGGREGPEAAGGNPAPPAPVAGGAGTSIPTPGDVVGPEARSAPGVPYTPSGADLSPAAAHLAGLPLDGAWTREDDLSLLRASSSGSFGAWCDRREVAPREARARLNLLTGNESFSKSWLIRELEAGV